MIPTLRPLATALILTGLGRSAYAQTTASAEVPARRVVSFDLAVGAMRYGPHALAGLEFSAPRWPLALRVDGMVGVAPSHDVPGRSFAATSLGLVLPGGPHARVSPYLFGGGAVSFSRHLYPALTPTGGLGLRLRLGTVATFVEARAVHRAGVPISLGVRF